MHFTCLSSPLEGNSMQARSFVSFVQSGILEDLASSGCSVIIGKVNDARDLNSHLSWEEFS